MLPTFVIGLREGLEASLIVGIVAAFLRKQGRTDALRWVWAGVVVAVLICLGVGVALRLLSDDLPQRQQEGLETVVGGVAVVMVTYMVVWMRRHARDLKGALEGAAGDALAEGSSWALVAMAFLAVLREGLETAVFLLAAFNASTSKTDSSLGAIIGILVAVGLGAALYRGGVRINLARFFRLTGLVLVLVAAGLVLTALHTANEAGWLNVGQQQTINLSWLVRPGTVQSSLLTGVLGLQPRPVLIELVGWLVYLVPVALYVGWPQGRRVAVRAVRRTATALGVGAAVAAVTLAVTAPAARQAPAAGTTTSTAATGSATVAADDTGLITPQRALATATSTTRVLRPGTIVSSGAVVVSGTPLTSYDRTWSLDADRRGTIGTARNMLPGFIFPTGSAASGTVWLADLGVSAPLRRIGPATRGGLATVEYQATGAAVAGPVAGLPTTTTAAQLSAANGGRLPLGLNTATVGTSIPIAYAPGETVTWWVDAATGVVIDTQRQLVDTAVVSSANGPLVIAPVVSVTLTTTPASVAAAAASAQALRHSADRHRLLAAGLPIGLGAAAVLLLGVAGLALLAGRRRTTAAAPDPAAATVPDPTHAAGRSVGPSPARARILTSSAAPAAAPTTAQELR